MTHNYTPHLGLKCIAWVRFLPMSRFNLCSLLFLLSLCSNSLALLNLFQIFKAKEKPQPDYALALIEYQNNEKDIFEYRLPEDTVLKNGQLVYKINPGEKIIFACPVDKENEIIKKVSKYFWASKYCLVEKEFYSFEDRKCTQSMEPTLLTMGMKETDRICGPTSMDFLLRFVYVNCNSTRHMNKILNEIIQKQLPYDSGALPSHPPIVEMYRVCYDNVKMKTVYTLHHISSPSLLLEENLPIQQLSATQEINTKQHIFTKDLFSKMKKAFDKQKPTSKYYMIPQMLVPKEDLVFATWKKATYHYINIAPLWRPLAPLMNLINERIRIISFRQNLKISVYTMAFNIKLQEYPEELYLNNERIFLIPNIWCKVIYHSEENSAIAIFMHNTPKYPPKSRLCDEDVDCRFKIWSKESQLSENGLIEDDIGTDYTEYAYCCQVTLKIMKYFRIKLNVKSVLNINDESFEKL